MGPAGPWGNGLVLPSVATVRLGRAIVGVFRTPYAFCNLGSFLLE